MRKTITTALITALAIASITAPGTATAKHLHSEKWYQKKHCLGKTEVVLPDETRCDCVTDTHAIEFDFGPKWAEAIGQALNYGLQTGKRPGVYLILESQTDYKFFIRINSIIMHYGLPIDVWSVGPGAASGNADKPK